MFCSAQEERVAFTEARLRAQQGEFEAHLAELRASSLAYVRW